MRFKEFGIKADGDDGGFTGYAATFDREPDCYGDVIAPGAFEGTLKRWSESGHKVPLLYGHNMDDPDYNIGWAEIAEDERGLKTVGHFDSSPKAQRVRQLLNEGRVSKMSFAYEVLDEAPVELEGGVTANELRELDVFEVSVVLVPANRHAEVIDSKSIERKYGMTISKATGGEISAAIGELEGSAEAIAKAIEILKALNPDAEEDTEAAPEDNTPQEGATDEGAAEEDPEEGNSAAKSGTLADKLIDLIY